MPAVDWEVDAADSFGDTDGTTIHDTTLDTGPSTRVWVCPNLLKEIVQTGTAGQIKGESVDGATNHWGHTDGVPGNDHAAGVDVLVSDRCGVAVRVTSGGAYALIRPATTTWNIYRTSDLGNALAGDVIGSAVVGDDDAVLEAIGDDIVAYASESAVISVEDSTHGSGTTGLVTRSNQIKSIGEFTQYDIAGAGGGPTIIRGLESIESAMGSVRGQVGLEGI
jgi:hypothetical protein